MINGKLSTDMQLKFNQYHRILGMMLILYILVRSYFGVDISQYIYLVLVGIWMLVEVLFSKYNKMQKIEFMALRYLEVCTAMFGVLYFDIFYSKIVALICMMLLAIEYFLCFEYTDRYERNICIFSAAIPFGIVGIIVFLIKGKPLEQFYAMLLAYIIYVVTAWYLANLFSKNVEKLKGNELKLTQKISLLEEENSNLLENKEKMQRVNQILSAQKAEIEKTNNKMKDTNIKLKLQNELVKHIYSSLNLDGLLELTTKMILNEIEVDVCAIIVNSEMDEIKTTIYSIASQIGYNFEINLEEEMKKSCFDKYIQKQKIYIDNYVEEGKYSFLKKGMIGSIIIIPFQQGEKGVGALFVGHSRYNYFIDNEWFYEAIATQITIAVKNAALYEEMKVLANRDGLTKVYNRGYLNSLYSEYLHKAVDEKGKLALVLFDIDLFKKINDTYGHIFGDEVIKRIALEGKKVAKKYGGFIGRYGGEEFVILYPNKNKEDVYRYAMELRENIKQVVFQKNEQSVQVNISGGITVYPDTCYNQGEL